MPDHPALPEDGADLVRALLRRTKAQTAAILLVDAAEHLRRTGALIEAATAAILTRMADGPAAESRDWSAALTTLTETEQAALTAYRAIKAEADALAE